MVVLVTHMGLNIGMEIIIFIVVMAVLDHYSHHGSMHTLPLSTRIGRATSWAEGCLGISSPMCITPNFYNTLAP